MLLDHKNTVNITKSVETFQNNVAIFETFGSFLMLILKESIKSHLPTQLIFIGLWMTCLNRLLGHIIKHRTSMDQRNHPH